MHELGRGTVEFEDPVSWATDRKGRGKRSTEVAKDALIMAKESGDKLEKQAGRANVLMHHTSREIAREPRLRLAADNGTKSPPPVHLP